VGGAMRGQRGDSTRAHRATGLAEELGALEQIEVLSKHGR